MGRWWNETDRKLGELEQALCPQCQCVVRHKSNINWHGIERMALRWETGDSPPESQHGQGVIGVSDLMVGTSDSGPVGVWRNGRLFSVHSAVCRFKTACGTIAMQGYRRGGWWRTAQRTIGTNCRGRNWNESESKIKTQSVERKGGGGGGR